jgi:membrane protease YdiL (CAAX protease family)
VLNDARTSVDIKDMARSDVPSTPDEFVFVNGVFIADAPPAAPADATKPSSAPPVPASLPVAIPAQATPAYVPMPDAIAAAERFEEKERRSSVLKVVAASIGLGVLVQIIAFVMGRDPGESISRRVTIGNLLVLALYGAVALLVARVLGGFKLNQRTPDDPPARAVITGIAVGLAAAFAVVAFVSALEGRWSSDNNVLLVLSERNAVNIVLVLVILAVLAPLIEEMLFRGLLVESMRSRGRSSAVLAGAVAFAFWHVNPLALRYYILMGVLLGFVYWRFGLAGSISAHATFNTALFVVGVLVLSGGPHVEDRGGVRMELPASWSVVDKGVPSGIDLAAESRTGAALAVVHIDAPSAIAGAQTFVAPPGAESPREIAVAEGKGTRFRLPGPGGEPTDIVVIQRGLRRWVVTLVPQGSTQAVREFDAILASLIVPTV